MCWSLWRRGWIVPDAAVELASHSGYRADKTDASGKSKGGGVCIYVHNNRCAATDSIWTYCPPDLEDLALKCRPFYIPREFTTVLIRAVYMPPQANAKQALEELHTAKSSQLTAYPKGIVIVAGDFNHVDLNVVLPKFSKSISFPTRDTNTLD